MNHPSIELVLNRLDSLGTPAFTGRMNLTLLGIRARPEHSVPNTFEDLLGAIYQNDQLNWQIELFPGTTKPGRYWLEHPGRVSGTGILLPGRHRLCWTFGMHRGQYRALCQRAPMHFVRDNDRDALPEVEGQDVGAPFDAIIGCNLHHAAVSHRSTKVDKWSSACQVVQDIEHFDHIMALADQSAVQYGPHFSYTLLDDWR